MLRYTKWENWSLTITNGVQCLSLILSNLCVFFSLPALTFLPMTFSALMGFSISSFCLSIYTDFYKTDASALGLNPRDPRWQGAWWLGFIIYGFILLACSVPFFFFPRKMDKPKSYCCFTGVPECCKVLTKRGGPPGGMGVPTGETPNAGTKLSKKTMEIIKGKSF